ncbi:hypothetical protein GP486_004394 [Trichoglossum hirsutum]|uniref:Xylanolytic transcriptional activator regulatory domain-containing protein n=1 Tax=Trichoglossum hirsutum TaxID=265104 RepID=A0A9P8RPT1_9PEZI|nr:hypothetical protein GP486_004394 [Trichoglossum hirsutum]
MGRIPQLPNSTVAVPKVVVFPSEDSELWSPYTDSGVRQKDSQHARTRAIALQISYLCEISSDLIMFFYNPTQMEKSAGKSAELKKLSELHTRLEAWRKNLPNEMGPEPKDTPLPPYNQTSSPLPSHVSPRKFCTQAASSISKLLRTYKGLYGLRQICNVAVYIAHSACTIHLLNLPNKDARRDIIHGLRHLEEIAEGWLCARRTLGIISLLSKRWKIELPEEADAVLALAESRWGPFNPREIPEMKSEMNSPRSSTASRSPPLAKLSREHKPYTMESSPSLNNSGIMDRVAAKDPAHLPQIEYQIAPQHHQPIDACTFYPSAQPQPYTSAKESQPSGSLRGSPLSVTGSTHGSAHGSTHGSTHSASPPALLMGAEIYNLVQESQDWWLRDQSALALGFDNWEVMEADQSTMGNSSMDGVAYVNSPDNVNTINAMNAAPEKWYM